MEEREEGDSRQTVRLVLSFGADPEWKKDGHLDYINLIKNKLMK